MKRSSRHARPKYSLRWQVQHLRFISRRFLRRLRARTLTIYLDRAGQTFPRKSRHAHIYTTTIFVVDRPYLTLGTIVVRGNRFADPEYLVQKMMRKARQIGADAIYGVQVEEEREASSPFVWNASGIAVKYKTGPAWFFQEQP
ncbi:MAG: hypothetical protein D6736_04120 [Nitrospinota bacterium]|nr:MAG: hypothetical protein D6736_04120 [Nitrospinota bacterium]